MKKFLNITYLTLIAVLFSCSSNDSNTAGSGSFNFEGIWKVTFEEYKINNEVIYSVEADESYLYYYEFKNNIIRTYNKHTYFYGSAIDYIFYSSEFDIDYSINYAEKKITIGADEYIFEYSDLTLTLVNEFYEGADKYSFISQLEHTDIDHFDVVDSSADVEEDLYESYLDDSFNTLNIMTPGDPMQSHSIHNADDEDYIKLDFTMIEPGTLVKIETLFNEIPTDTEIYLFNSEKVNLYSDSNSGYESLSRLIVSLDPGVYYLLIKGNNYVNKGKYYIDIQMFTKPSADIYEVDNDFSTSNVMKPGDPAQAHTFHNTNDNDYIKLDLNDILPNTILRIKCSHLSMPTSPTIILYNSSESPIAASSFTGSDGYPEIVHNFKYPGIYYIKINNLDYGNYLIDVQAFSPLGGDVYERDDNFSMAKEIRVDALPQVHNLHYPGDEDFMILNLTDITGSTPLKIELYKGYYPDIDIYLYDSNFNLLDYESSNNTFYFTRIVHTFTNAGIYYIRVKEGSSSYSNKINYKIDVQSFIIPEADQYENDNDFSTTNIIIPGDPAQLHTFHTQYDNDFIQLDLSGAQPDTAIEIDTYGTTLDLGTHISIYDAGMNPLKTYFFNMGSPFENVVWIFNEPDIYYINIEYQDTLGEYYVSITEYDEGGDIYEPDNGFSTTNQLIINADPQEHSFDFYKDEDWCYLDLSDLTTDITLKIETHELTNPYTYTAISLYDSGENCLANVSSGGDDRHAKLIYTFDTAGVYYIRVSANSYSSDLLDYSIDVREEL